MISIAMTTYNGEAYIEEQFRSLLAQTEQPNEIVICDDRSTDRTVDILCEICEETLVKKANSVDESALESTPDSDPTLNAPFPQIVYASGNGDLIVRIIQNPKNIGYIENFYRAISLTHGDYIFLCDQDDSWHIDKIARSIDTLEETHAAAMCCNCTLIDADGNAIPNKNAYRLNPMVKKLGPADGRKIPISFHRLIFGNITQGCTYCFTAKVRENYLALHSNLLIHDHQIMFIASLMEGGVIYLHEELLDYRIHEQNAIGFEKTKASSVDANAYKHLSKKPFMVRFVEELQTVMKVPHAGYYKLLYYLRIPYIGSKMRGF